MRVGIVGTAGFVGRFISQDLVKQGHSVVPLSRVPTHGIATFARSGTHHLEKHSIVDEIVACDAVVNCAGEIPSRGTPETLELVNGILPELLYSLCKEARVRSFVHISSVAALGSVSKPGGSISDVAEPAPGSAYGRSKLAGDQRLMAAEASQTRLVILRPPMLYGPGAKGVFGLFAKAAKKRIRLPIRSLKNKRNFVFVGNLANAVTTVIERSAVTGCYLVTDSEAMTPGEFYDALAHASIGRSLTWCVPPMLLHAAGRVLLRSRFQSLFSDAVYDSARFRSEAGWSPPFQLEYAVKTTIGATPT